MRNELIDIAELSDSREVMAQKTPPSIRWFIVIVAVIVAVALVFANFGEIDTYVKASGEVRPSAPVSTITIPNGGKLSEILFHDGANIKKGDVLFRFDCDYYLSQKDFAESQIANKNTEIENYNRLIEAIESDTNSFDKGIEPKFYYQYKSYEIEANNAISNIDSSDNQLQASLSEIETAISQSEASLEKAKGSYSDYKAFYKVISDNGTYKGNNQTLKDSFNSYQISLDKAQAVYQGYKLQYDTLKRQHKDNSDIVTKEQVEQALYAMNSAHADVEAVTAGLLAQINEITLSLEQEIVTHESAIESYKTKKESLIQTENKDSTVQQIKDQYFLNINNAISTLYMEIDSINEQLVSINETIMQSEIKAESDGVLVYSQEFSIGDSLSAGIVLGTVVPSTESHEVVIYIPEYSIGEVSEEQEVEYIFSSISSTDFGKVYGTLTDISKDSFVDQSTGQKFYKAVGTITKTVLSNKTGESRKIQAGMLVEVHAITGRRTVLNWLLDKLNFS